MKKITFLITSLEGGGAEGVCVNLANGLSAIGWEVELLVLHMNNSFYHNFLNEKVKLTVLGVENARYALFPLTKYTWKNDVDKILIFNYELTVIAVLVRIFTKKKFKIMARNINTISKNILSNEKNMYGRLVSKIINVFYKKVDFIVNQSRGMMDDLVCCYPEVKSKTTYINNPVRNQIESYAKSIDFNQIDKEEFVLCVGRLEEQKAFHYAIEVFASVCKKHKNLRLKIIGKGSLENDLKQLAKKLMIENKVDFEGFQNNTISYYEKAKLVLLTSLYEGFPNVLVESITLGTPVVSFDCPSGPREIVVNHKNGYLVNYLDKEDLEVKLTQALNKDWDYDAIRDDAKRYSIENIILEWENVISKI